MDHGNATLTRVFLAVCSFHPPETSPEKVRELSHAVMGALLGAGAVDPRVEFEPNERIIIEIEAPDPVDADKAFVKGRRIVLEALAKVIKDRKLVITDGDNDLDTLAANDVEERFVESWQMNKLRPRESESDCDRVLASA